MHKIHNHCIRTSSPTSISRISSSIPRIANPTLASRSLHSSSRAFSSIDKPVVSRQAPANANSSLVTSKIHNSTTTRNILIPNISNTHSRTYAAMATEGKQGVHNLTSKKDFDAALSDKEQVMVVDFFATWCGPCKVIAPQVVKMSDTYPTARFYKLDVDEVPDVAQELGIRAMPTFVLFKGGEKISEVVGANPKALEAAIQGAI